MKKSIIILILAVNLSLAATFQFKDGTVVNGEIFEEPFSIANPSPTGIFLKVNGKFYLHHYPSKVLKKEVIIDHGNGTYTIKEENEIVPTPAPPEAGEMNPYQLPNCVPARINFIHFSPKTLNDLYKYYFARTAYFKKVNNPLEFRNNKNIALGIYKAAYSKKYKLNSPKLSSEWKAKVNKEYGKIPSSVTWFGD
jgi:hypothetical protein